MFALVSSMGTRTKGLMTPEWRSILKNYILLTLVLVFVVGAPAIMLITIFSQDSDVSYDSNP